MKSSYHLKRKENRFLNWLTRLVKIKMNMRQCKKKQNCNMHFIRKTNQKMTQTMIKCSQNHLLINIKHIIGCIHLLRLKKSHKLNKSNQLSLFSNIKRKCQLSTIIYTKNLLKERKGLKQYRRTLTIRLMKIGKSLRLISSLINLLIKNLKEIQKMLLNTWIMKKLLNLILHNLDRFSIFQEYLSICLMKITNINSSKKRIKSISWNL